MRTVGTASARMMTSAATVRADGAPAAIALDTSHTCRTAKTISAAAAWTVIRRPRLRAGGTLCVVRPIGRAPNVDAIVQPPRLAFPEEIRGFQPFIPKSSHRRTRSEEHTSELQSLMRISYAVFCL